MMGMFLITDDEYNRLSETRRIAGAFVNLAAAAGAEDKRVEFRVTEVIAMFDMVERQIANVLESAAQRYTLDPPGPRRKATS